MPVSYKGITVKFAADVGDVSKKIRSIDKEVRSLDQILKETNKGLKLDPKNMDLIGQKMTTVTDEAQKLRSKLSELEYLREQMRSTDTSGFNEKELADYNQSLTLLEKEIVKVNTQLANMKYEAEAAAKAFKKEFSEGIGQINDGLSQLARIAVRAEAAFAGLTVKAVKTGAEFDAAMSNVAATLDIEQVINRSESAFARLRAQAVTLGRETTFTSTEAAQALNYLALGGLGVEKSMQALPRVLTLAKAGSMELSEAANTVVASMSALGLDTAEIDTLLDQMARTAQRSKVTVEQVGTTILTTASAFNLAGQDSATMNAIIGTLGNKFKDISEQANTLRTALTRLSTKKDDLAELGVNIEENGKIRDFIDIFTDLREALETKTDSEKTSILTKIFGQRGYTYAAYLMESTRGDIQALRAEIENADGAAQNMADTMTDNLQSDLIILKSAVDALSISVSDRLTPGLRDGVSNATDEINRLTDNVQNGELGSTLDELGKDLDEMISKGSAGIVDAAPTIIKVLTTILEHARAIVTLILSVKVGEWSANMVKGVLNVGEAISNLAKIAKSTPNAISAIASVDTIASVATLSGALVTLGIVITDVARRSSEARTQQIKDLFELDEETKKLISTTNDYIDTAKEEIELRDRDIKDAQKKGDNYKELAQRVIELADGHKLAGEELDEMYSAIIKLNQEIPELGLSYNNTTGEINMQKQELFALVDGYSKYMQVKAKVQHIEELSNNRDDLQFQLDDVTDQRKSAEYRLGQLEEYKIKENGTLAGSSRYDTDIAKAQHEVDVYLVEEARLKKQLDNTNKAIEENSKGLDKLKDDYYELYASKQGDAEADLILIEQAHDLIDEYGEQSDELQDLINAHPELREQLEAEGYQLSVAAEETDELTAAQQALADRMEQASQAADSSKSALSGFLDILRQVSEGTKYSTAQMIDLIEKYPELSKYIKETKDGYILEEEAVRKLTIARANDAVEAARQASSAAYDYFYSIAGSANATGEQKSQALKQKEEAARNYENVLKATEDIRNGRIYLAASDKTQQQEKTEESSTSNTTSPDTPTSETPDTTDYHKQAAEEEIDQAEYEYKTGLISAREYYERLRDINRRYYQDKAEYLEEYRKLEEQTYEGLAKAQEEELSNAKELEDRLEAVRKAQQELERASAQQVQVYSAAAGFHSEKNSAAIGEAQSALDSSKLSLTELLMKLTPYQMGESLSDRLSRLDVSSVRSLLPDLSALSLPTAQGNITNSTAVDNTRYTSRSSVTYAPQIIIQGSVDEATLARLRAVLKEDFEKFMEEYLLQSTRQQQTGG